MARATRATRASGERKPKATRVISRILVLTDSMRPLERPCSIAARIESRCYPVTDSADEAVDVVWNAGSVYDLGGPRIGTGTTTAPAAPSPPP
jgi:hypothetical protein